MSNLCVSLCFVNGQAELSDSLKALWGVLLWLSMRVSSSFT